MSKDSKKTSYWDHAVLPREHCYTILPNFLNKKEKIDPDMFSFTYGCIGLLGYKIRESGYCAGKIVVSLNKRISQEHKGLLGKIFDIKEDSGDDLHFC